MNREELERWAHPRLLLVATNLADHPGLVLHAISQARRTGAGILLVHVLPAPSLRTAFGPKPDARITGSRMAAAWEVIDRASKMIEWQGVRCEAAVLEGDPAEEIPRLAEARNADRVIVATRSMRGIGRLVQGSVAEALMMAAPVPVCVIGPGVLTSSCPDTTEGRVLLAWSLHHAGSFYLNFAVELAYAHHASLIVLHILDVAGLTPAEKGEAYRAAEAKLNEAIARAGSTALRTEAVLREGDPAGGILKQGVCPGRDFIVMGAASLSVLSRLLGSSVVHRVVAQARCPVITIRERNADRNHSRAAEAVEAGSTAA